MENYLFKNKFSFTKNVTNIDKSQTIYFQLIQVVQKLLNLVDIV